MREAAIYAPAPCKLIFDLLTLKVVSVRVTCNVGYTSVPIYFSLPGPLCSRLRPEVRDRQTDVRRASSLNAPYPRSGGKTIICTGQAFPLQVLQICVSRVRATQPYYNHYRCRLRIACRSAEKPALFHVGARLKPISHQEISSAVVRRAA